MHDPRLDALIEIVRDLVTEIRGHRHYTDDGATEGPDLDRALFIVGLRLDDLRSEPPLPEVGEAETSHA